MIAILTTHPIQYQVPLWQMLAAGGRVPFEVWYLSQHATQQSRDREFGQVFSWDLNMLEGYPHRFLQTPAGATPNTLFRSRIAESLPALFQKTKTEVLWVQGWQVAAYWQAVRAAHRLGIQVWLRGESNALAPTPVWKRAIKRAMLGSLFRKVDHFLCIGSANRELYRSYGVPESKLHMAPYAVDNARFQRQATAIRDSRLEIRDSWKIPRDAFCVLFCGKFIPKKHPLDLIKAAHLLLSSHPDLKMHLLFVGSGELGAEMRAHCSVVFDADSPNLSLVTGLPRRSSSSAKAGHSSLPSASFTGFLNQTEISKAYVAADVLVLPSDYSETWGLVVNEAMASGLPCVISDRCGCSPDLGADPANSVFEFGNVRQFGKKIADSHAKKGTVSTSAPPSLAVTSTLVENLYAPTAQSLAR